MRAALHQFELLNQVWRRLKANAVSDYRIGNLRLRLVFANKDWAKKITPAFRHLEVETQGNADLTVRFWDSSSSGLPLPNLNWDLLNRNGYAGTCEDGFYFHYFAAISALSAFHSSEKVAYYMARDNQSLPWWVDGSPLQAILHPWLREQGLQMTHTAAVADEGSAVLLTGKGGSGKSTTTLTCLRAGMFSLGEDYCLLQPGNVPQVYSIYQSAKLTKSTRQLFPHYESHVCNPVDAQSDKALIYYDEIFPGQIRAHLPIRALVSLHVGQEDVPMLHIESKKSALKNLMLSTLTQLPFYNPETMSLLNSIVESVTTYRLVLGRNLESNAKLIQSLLERQAA